MKSLQAWDVDIGRDGLKGRSFLLGNKRAFSLTLPAAAGTSDLLLHEHKWYGAYLYGRKFLEGQVVRVHAQRDHFLGSAQQVGVQMSLTGARREYRVEGKTCTEEFFVPDGIQGFACTLTGDVSFVVEPEFDIRFYRALQDSIESYEVELLESGAVISNVLPDGEYDDATETFRPSEGNSGVRVFAAVELVGESAGVELVPSRRRARRKTFWKDVRRQRFIAHSAPGDAAFDHAPLWNQSTSVVYAPVKLLLHGHGDVIYGFGTSREEAIEQATSLRENLIAFRAQKTEQALEILDRARFETGVPAIDRAYGQVLMRLMEALVARNAVAEDTALDKPSTMILAGNQYFHDSWKRDENIALGFLLALGFYDLARDVIRDTWQLQDPRTGRLPQRIRAGEDPPYHSSDGTLWALWRLYQYWRCTGDDALLLEKLPMVRLFFKRSVERVVDGMLPSGRTQSPEYLWETWMDTPHTPRDGFPVEIQMLWIACLRSFRPLVKGPDPELEACMAASELAAWQALERFNVRGMPADSLDEQGAVRDLITPNPYFSFGVGLDLGHEVESAMRQMGRRQLAGKQGIITLAPEDWSRVYSPEFLSDRRNVRGRRMQSIGKFNYHRGVEWNWLTQFFVWAELKYGEPDMAYRRYLRGQVSAVLERGGIGGISELFDLKGTRGPDFQAWSMSGFLESLHGFAGVRIDVPERRISIEPQIPGAWPNLSVRKWYGSVPFDLTYSADEMTRSLHIEFPWGEPPEAELEISLVVPAHRVADFLSVTLDGDPHSPVYSVLPIPGMASSRIKFTVSARAAIDVTLGVKRVSSRARLSA